MSKLLLPGTFPNLLQLGSPVQLHYLDRVLPPSATITALPRLNRRFTVGYPVRWAEEDIDAYDPEWLWLDLEDPTGAFHACLWLARRFQIPQDVPPCWCPLEVRGPDTAAEGWMLCSSDSREVVLFTDRLRTGQDGVEVPGLKNAASALEALYLCCLEVGRQP